MNKRTEEVLERIKESKKNKVAGNMIGVKEKDIDILISEYKKKNEELDQLEQEKQNVIEKLELRIKLIEQNIKLTNDYYYKQELKAKLEITEEILSLVKGEK